MSRRGSEETTFFWELVEPMMAEDGVDEGSLMGFPCLRTGGDFFATCDHRSGDLIVKLSRGRVAELVDAGTGEPFAPAGRVFKEWVRVPGRDEAQWLALLREAKAFVGS